VALLPQLEALYKKWHKDGLEIVGINFDDKANVLVGPETVSAKVLHSYFLVVDLEGNIVESVPKITRQY
jgi:hypothetical protein